VLIILHPSVKLKMPSEAAATVHVRGAQSPVAAAAAPTSRLTKLCRAHFCVTLCHGSMETSWGYIAASGGGWLGLA